MGEHWLIGNGRALADEGGEGGKEGRREGAWVA